jgi:hypothetical protein
MLAKIAISEVLKWTVFLAIVAFAFYLFCTLAK